MLTFLTLPPLYLYVARLIRMFPFTHHVTSYISIWPEQCRRKYQDPFLEKVAKELLADELGHDQLILKDLKDLKIPIQAALNEFRSKSVERQIAAFSKSVAADPLHLLAWLFYAEKLAVDRVKKEVLESYQKMLGPFRTAIRFWRIHSAVGPEVEHVKKRQQWILNFSPTQQQVIKRELDEVATLFSRQTFDLDFEKFERFINFHASHLYEIAHKETINAIDRFYF